MTADAYPALLNAVVNLPTSKSFPGLSGTMSNQRAPTDPYYYADVDVRNMVVDSRWILGYDDDGTFIELDSGTCTVTDFTISSVPAYGSPFLLEMRARKSSAAPKYKPFRSFAIHHALGVTIYVSQVPDDFA